MYCMYCVILIKETLGKILFDVINYNYINNLALCGDHEGGHLVGEPGENSLTYLPLIKWMVMWKEEMRMGPTQWTHGITLGKER